MSIRAWDSLLYNREELSFTDLRFPHMKSTAKYIFLRSLGSPFFKIQGSSQLFACITLFQVSYARTEPEIFSLSFNSEVRDMVGFIKQFAFELKHLGN